MAAMLFGATGMLSTDAGATPVAFVDEAGSNDVPGQADLTRLTIDGQGTATLAVTWQWDVLGTSGNNMLNACALFDSNGGGLANIALCHTTKGNPAVSIDTRLYLCSDLRADRCSGPTQEAPGTFTSVCVAVTLVALDPFPTGDSYPNDAQASCTLQLADFGGGTAALLNVCSYPSQEPNSDPSDCVLVPRDATFTITKVVVNDNGGTKTCPDFSFQIDGGTAGAFEGDCSNAVLVAPGVAHTVTEVGVPIAGYTTTTSNCTAVTLASGGSATCTITNNDQAPTPCPEQDCDGVADSTDNCVSVFNPDQANSDRNFIDQTPPSSQDDRTWPMSDSFGDACDTDDDNDGILDVNETAGCNASGALSATNRDTDGDRVLDGAECALGFNPASVASKPTAAQCAAFLGVGASVDTDGDRLFDRVEFCSYNTNRLLLDTDGDQDAFPLNANPAVNLIRDGCEAASLNNDRVVNSADQLLIALEITREVDQTLRLVSMDINKDGGVNSGDQLLMVGFIVTGGSCP
jgi:hypothetical protein